MFDFVKQYSTNVSNHCKKGMADAGQRGVNVLHKTQNANVTSRFFLNFSFAFSNQPVGSYDEG